MQHYVLIYAERKNSENQEDEVLLILKERPDWQKGRLNLVGGKIEKNETSGEAAKREFEEETGLKMNLYPIHIGDMTFENCIIYCYTYKILLNTHLNPRPEETEKVAWYNIKNVLYSPNLMPNLRLLIPLLKYNIPFRVNYEKYEYPTLTTSLEIYG